MARACPRSKTAGRAPCEIAFRSAARGRPLSGVRLAHARERLLVLRAGLAFLLIDAVMAEGARDGRARRAWRPKARSARERLRRARDARLSPAGADHLAQSQPDPHHGAARHPGPLSRLVRRRLLDRPQSAAADADVFLRLRRRAATRSSSTTRAAPDSRSTFSPACCPGWPSAKPPAARRR